jgi:hypothetical protein
VRGIVIAMSSRDAAMLVTPNAQVGIFRLVTQLPRKFYLKMSGLLGKMRWQRIAGGAPLNRVGGIRKEL